MRFDEGLRMFAEFFEREGILYAIAGDLALHIHGYRHARPRIDFVVAAKSRAEIATNAASLGFSESAYTSSVAVYACDTTRVALIFAARFDAFPGVFFEHRFLPVLDPARHLPLSEDDIAALETATMTLPPEESLAWLSFMSAIASPSRLNQTADEPFTL